MSKVFGLLVVLLGLDDSLRFSCVMYAEGGVLSVFLRFSFFPPAISRIFPEGVLLPAKSPKSLLVLTLTCVVSHQHYVHPRIYDTWYVV